MTTFPLYLTLTVTSTKEVMFPSLHLFSCWLVCQQHLAKAKQISTEVRGRTGHGPKNNPLNFGGDLDEHNQHSKWSHVDLWLNPLWSRLFVLLS